MKNEVKSAFKAKKQYNAPSTITTTLQTDYVCQTLINSIQGNGPGWGGPDNTIDPG